MIKQSVAACAAVFMLSGCSAAVEESAAVDDSTASTSGAAAATSDADFGRELFEGEPDALPAALGLASQDSELPEQAGEGVTGVDELLAQPDSLPVLDARGGTSEDPYSGLDIDQDELGIETADFSFEARSQPDGFSGVGESVSVPVGSIVAFSLVTDQLGEMFVESVDISAQTNGDVAQVVFAAEDIGVFPIVLRVDGNSRLITTLVVHD